MIICKKCGNEVPEVSIGVSGIGVKREIEKFVSEYGWEEIQAESGETVFRCPKCSRNQIKFQYPNRKVYARGL